MEHIKQLIREKKWPELTITKRNLENILLSGIINNDEERKMEAQLQEIEKALEGKENPMDKFDIDFSVMKYSITIKAKDKRDAAEIGKKIMYVQNEKITKENKEKGDEWAILRIRKKGE